MRTLIPDEAGSATHLAVVTILALIVTGCGTPPSDDGVEIPPLVEDGDVDIPPLVEDAEVPLEPLIPPGSDLAEAYRVEIRHTYTSAFDAGIATDTQDGAAWYGGDLVRVGDDRYEGTFVVIASLDQTAVNLLGDTCHVTWTGRQVAGAVGIVGTADSLAGYMLEGEDAGGLYLPMYLTDPIGPVDWSDPDDDCGGTASEFLPIDYNGPELQGSSVGAAAPRLPPPGYGKIEERIEEDAFGVAYEWVFTLTPISISEVQEVEVGDGPIEIPPLVDE